MPETKYIIGADECGYGAWFSTLVVCAFRAPINWTLAGLNDSKKLTARQRETMNSRLLDLLAEQSLSYAIAERTNDDIDNYGLSICLKECYSEAVGRLYSAGTKIIIDGTVNLKQYGERFGSDVSSMIKADESVPVVMAGSIIGKVYRDSIMRILGESEKYKKYDVGNCMGYGSPKHLAAIKEFGFSDLHRKSYKIKGINK